MTDNSPPSTKRTTCNQCILSVLICAAETWRITKELVEKLKFHLAHNATENYRSNVKRSEAEWVEEREIAYVQVGVM